MHTHMPACTYTCTHAQLLIFILESSNNPVIVCSPLPLRWEPLSLWPTTPKAFTSAYKTSSYFLQIWENKAIKRSPTQRTTTKPISVKDLLSLALLLYSVWPQAPTSLASAYHRPLGFSISKADMQTLTST